LTGSRFYNMARCAPGANAFKFQGKKHKEQIFCQKCKRCDTLIESYNEGIASLTEQI
jgi:hypothetical protein